LTHFSYGEEGDAFLRNVGNPTWLYGVTTQESTVDIFTILTSSDIRMLLDLWRNRFVVEFI
jgi:hypothetical protein